MKRIQSFILMVVSLLVFSVMPVMAILIDFQEIDGYTSGDLDGQPTNGTQWVKLSGDANSFTVTGSGTDHILLADTTTNAAANMYSFKPTDTDLDTSFSATRSKITFSYDIQWPGVNIYDYHIGRVYIGGNASTAILISEYSDGGLRYNDGASTLRVKDAGGNIFHALTSSWYTVNGILDYESNTFTLEVNGVVQTNSSGSSNISFKDLDAKTTEIILFSVNANNGAYKSVNYDNIKIESAAPYPEPDNGLLLDFKESDGYTDGELLGQPAAGTQWGRIYGETNSFEIVGLTDQIVRAQRTSGSGANKYSFIPTDSDLGAIFNNNHSEIDYHINVQFMDINTHDYHIGRVYFGGDASPAIFIAEYSDGGFRYYDGASALRGKDAGGNIFYAASMIWYDIEGRLNYQTKTYTLTINGVAQTNSLGGFDINFYNSASSSLELNLFSVNGDNSAFSRINYDNIVWAPVPPQGTVVFIK